MNRTLDQWSLMKPDAFLEGSIVQARNVIEMAQQDIASLATELQQPFICLFMDGRNEHGTHLLVLPPDGLGLHDKEAETFISDQNEAERIFREAEALGHETGHCFISIWRRDHGDPYEGGYDPYWEYQRISPILTEIFCGSAGDQKRQMAEAVAHEDAA